MSDTEAFSKDSRSLHLAAEGLEEIERFVAIAALGMCRALTSGSVSPAYACHRLFGPALLARLERIGAHPELQDMIHRATEFDDVATVIPGQLMPAIASIEHRLVQFLREVATEPAAGHEKWLTRALEGRDCTNGSKPPQSDT